MSFTEELDAQIERLAHANSLGSEIQRLNNVEEKKLSKITIYNKDSEEATLYSLTDQTLVALAKLVRDDLQAQYDKALKDLKK